MTITQTLLEDYLAFWHPSLDEQIDEDHLDFGAVAAGSSGDLLVRVRNCSDTYWATGVLLAVDADEPAVRHLLSQDAARFTATLQLAALAPLSVTDPITLRQVIAPGATGDHLFRLTAAATGWS